MFSVFYHKRIKKKSAVRESMCCGFFVCADIYKKGSLRPDSTEESHMFFEYAEQNRFAEKSAQRKNKSLQKGFLDEKKIK